MMNLYGLYNVIDHEYVDEVTVFLKKKQDSFSIILGFFILSKLEINY